MASKRQIRANRTNAQQSTGPRSKAGKQASSRNALRHGLAVFIGADLAYHDEIEKLALVLLAENVQDSGIAHEAAEATLDLSRIRKIRTSLVDNLHSSGPVDEARLEELSADLAKLERYERRAFSRRNRALRAIASPR